MRCSICKFRTGSLFHLPDYNLLSLDVNNPKFRKLVGKDAKAETMERELERVSAYGILSHLCHVLLISSLRNFDREKEREHENLDAVHNEATKNLQQVETTFTNMKAQLKLKKEEVQGLHCPPPSPLS